MCGTLKGFGLRQFVYTSVGPAQARRGRDQIPWDYEPPYLGVGDWI